MALDPVLFARDTLGFNADDWQARVLRWSGKRLLLNCSRQSGKSTTTAIVALHRALYAPGALVLMVSPSQRQSSELFRKVVDFLNRLDVRPALAEDNRLSVKFEHGARIVSLPSSEATIRGFSGASLIIEDEASRVSDDLYFAVRPMLAVSGGQLILMSTPYGKRGHFYAEWEKGGDAWERVRITAEECPRIRPDFLADERRALGEWFYSQEYLCEFRDTTDQYFASDLIERAITDKIKPLWERSIANG
jgi:hypothetical protein